MKGETLRIATLTRRHLPLLVYVALSGIAVAQLALIGRPWGALALLPLALGGVRGIISSSAAFKLAYLGSASFDPIPTTQAAWERVLDGLSPYGVPLTSSGNPFPYGPLALPWWAPGVAVEIIASIALLIVLRRTPVTMAVVAGLHFFHYLASAGNNDFSPALLLVGGLFLLRERPLVAGGLVAASVALKPYTAVWILSAVTIGGVPVAISFAVATTILWSPVLVWGFDNLAASLRGSAGGRDFIGAWQPYVAGLLVVASAFAPWQWSLLAGSAAFTVMLFSPVFLHVGYLVPLIVVTGIALEWRAGPSAKRARIRSEVTTSAA